VTPIELCRLPLCRWAVLTVAAIVLVGVSHRTVIAQDYPAKPLKFILPFAPGGSADRLGRLFAKRLGDRWQQSVVVENKPGATGMIGAEVVVTAPADGYTVLFTSTALVQAPILSGKAPYEVERDFAPVSHIADLSVVLVVRSDSPIRNLDDYIAAARKPDASVNYGSIGIGSSLHIYGEVLTRDANVNLIHVPYRGEAPVLTDIIGGHLVSSFLSVGLALEFIRAGKVRPLGVIGNQRSANLPGVPSFGELGYPRLEALGWYGLLLPKATPSAIVEKMATEIKSILNEPETLQQLREMGLEPSGEGPKAFAEFLKKDATRWRSLILDVGMIQPASAAPR
jgi:tripartite-type tricarboxylate transporter receptor subunit TctC